MIDNVNKYSLTLLQGTLIVRSSPPIPHPFISPLSNFYEVRYKIDTLLHSYPQNLRPHKYNTKQDIPVGLILIYLYP